ncbi:MAG: cytochrome c oxidase assembly protein [Candidatus Rokuibacteriota bacterium]|nr:MAG: cytochrome c oxidase assembly protein [Candidatus Rokubacteria bacterium]
MWEWRPEVLVPLGLVAIASGVGWWRLSERGPRAVPRWRPVLLAGGLTAVVAALLSPIAGTAHARFSTHMIQHVLLVMLAPPLFMLADPLPAALWALPRSVRLAAGRLLAPGALVRRLWRALTWPPAAWLVSALALWLWHLPGAYEAALRDDLLHDAEHLVLFWVGILGWWPLIGPSPRVRGHLAYSLRVVYLVLTGGQQALLGLLLSTSPVVLYGSYEAGAAARGLSPLDDQADGGVIMWATSGVVGLVTLMVLMYRLLAQEDRLPPIEGPPALAPVSPLPRKTLTSFLPSPHD